MKNTIVSLEKAFNDKIPYLALVNSRQENRMLRPGAELVKDTVARCLNDESTMLKFSTEQIENALMEVNNIIVLIMFYLVEQNEIFDICRLRHPCGTWCKRKPSWRKRSISKLIL